MGDLLIIETKEAVAKIALYGGCICAYGLSDGFDILRPLQNNHANDPLMASSFALVPYSNRIENGTLNFRGEKYQLPLNFGEHPHSIHGVGWQSLWRVVAKTENQVILELPFSGKGWPFAFLARQTFTLSEAALVHKIELTNMSGRSMPAGLGMHPYFPRHGNAVLTVNARNVWVNDDTGLPIKKIPAPENWNFDDGRNVDTLSCDNLFEPWQGSARISWPDKKKSVELSASEDLDRLVVYAPTGEDFFCVEPVSHITNSFNLSENGMPLKDSGMRILRDRESWSVWMQITPIS
ncbi:MAG: aldose 1-epimerase [Sneathiella sp.]|nr:aldose 1-epimerase [Sneathiella sp.]